MAEDFIKNKNKKTIFTENYLPLCYSWNIPNQKNCEHPCASAIRVNSLEYFCLLHRGYHVTDFEDAFFLLLENFKLPENYEEKINNFKKEEICIEFYDKNKHSGLEEFYEDIQAIDFEKCIRRNLELEKPLPFLVVSVKGKIKGWTGALWNEVSGRAHFDGIIISESIRGKGLGKLLFTTLAYQSKLNGAKYMSFHTGLKNNARYVYLGLGFKIVQTYAFMEKSLK